jgi:hypothetical protein
VIKHVIRIAGLGIGLSLGLPIASALPGAWERPGIPVHAVPASLQGTTLSEQSSRLSTTARSPFASSSIDAQYEAMRDDVNPKPRLLLLDTWARDASPDASLDPLGRALVDPDPSVRERAQALFDRRLATR